MEFTVINSGDMEFTPRGRKSSASPELIAALKALKAGQALRLDSLKVSATDRKGKARVSARIRAAAKAATRDIEIRWTRDGVPQVALAK